MSHDPDAYRCPKCGATSALLMPEPIPQAAHVALKCLGCAHVLRLPRTQVAGVGGQLDSTSPLE